MVTKKRGLGRGLEALLPKKEELAPPKTGLEEIPRSIEGLAKHGLKSKQDIKNFLEVDGIDNSLWEKTLTIPYKYNRLVLFRPWLFHSPGKSFGKTLESSRIVQTLFLGN